MNAGALVCVCVLCAPRIASLNSEEEFALYKYFFIIISGKTIPTWHSVGERSYMKALKLGGLSLSIYNIRLSVPDSDMYRHCGILVLGSEWWIKSVVLRPTVNGIMLLLILYSTHS